MIEVLPLMMLVIERSLLLNEAFIEYRNRTRRPAFPVPAWPPFQACLDG
jgi:hypothetical protein